MQRVFLLLLFLLTALPANHARGQSVPAYTIQPGDTWAALATRYGLEESALKTLNTHMNATREPTIGRPFALPEDATERAGRLIRPNDGGLLQTAAMYSLSPWAIAGLNGLTSPYRPTLRQPLYLPGDGLIRDLPPGMETLDLSQIPAAPGQALGLRGTLSAESLSEGSADDNAITARLDSLPVMTTTSDNRFVGVVGTGAFYVGGEPELLIRVGDGTAWTQPWAFADREWEYQELTLTGDAALIDQQARDEERARLRELWTQITSGPQWDAAFTTPITDTLGVSANYGARRSYNGGPYLTYHEGVDFSAYAGTPVYAPAAGTVVLAEPLYVRGGAVIIDHGLGIYTGYYHLSAIHTAAGQVVALGDLLGEVGTTGLSTGNHLHWDLLVNGVWVDAAVWQEQDLACWLLAGLSAGCLTTASALIIAVGRVKEEPHS